MITKDHQVDFLLVLDEMEAGTGLAEGANVTSESLPPRHYSSAVRVSRAWLLSHYYAFLTQIYKPGTQ